MRFKYVETHLICTTPHEFIATAVTTIHLDPVISRHIVIGSRTSRYKKKEDASSKETTL